MDENTIFTIIFGIFLCILLIFYIFMKFSVNGTKLIKNDNFFIAIIPVIIGIVYAMYQGIKMYYVDKPVTPNAVVQSTLALGTYPIMIGAVVIMCILFGIMWNKNRGGFNALFGKEIYITLTTIIVISILLFFLHGSTEVKDNNQLSTVDNMSSKLLKAGIGLTAIIGFISILSVGGIFSSNPPENNLAMLLNLFILIILKD